MAGFCGGTDEEVGLWVDPEVAEAIAAGEFAAVGDAGGGGVDVGGADEVEVAVVGVGVDADDEVGLEVFDKFGEA